MTLGPLEPESLPKTSRSKKYFRKFHPTAEFQIEIRAYVADAEHYD
jgi:hypothetical protein